MAYSHNNRQLILALCKQGHSPEEVERTLSRIASSDTGRTTLDGIATKCGVLFTELDWQEICEKVPSPKTIHEWLRTASKETDTETHSDNLDILKGGASLDNDHRVFEQENELILKREEPQEINAVQNESELPEPCSASPDMVDVSSLRSWGIPAKKAPAILSEWLGSHRKGSHEMCQSFGHFKEDLIVRKIPFKQAEINLEAELWAREFEVIGMLEDIELRRKYRSWENTYNYNTFIKEVDIRNRPAMEAREKHLTEIASMLSRWKAEIEEALPEDKYETVLNISQNALFESMMTHCSKIAQTYEKLRFPSLKQEEKSQLINRLLKEIDRTLLEKSCANKWCLDCVREPTGPKNREP